MSSSKISGLSHPVRSQLGSLTISLACCVVKGADLGCSYCVSSLTGVTFSSELVVSSISIGSVTGLHSLRGDMEGECSASLLLGLFTGVNGVF